MPGNGLWSRVIFYESPKYGYAGFVKSPRPAPLRRILPPRDPRGGRPTQEIAARLGVHILEVALLQFIEKGAEGTSMDDIAAAANVSKRTLYARYGSKVGLLIAAIEHGIDNRLNPIVATMGSGSPRQRLIRIARQMLDRSLEPDIIGLERLLLWVQTQNFDGIDSQAVLRIDPGLLLIHPLLRDVAGPDKKNSLDLPFLATFIFDALVTAPRQRILARGDLADTREAKDAYLEQALDFLGRALPFLQE